MNREHLRVFGIKIRYPPSANPTERDVPYLPVRIPEVFIRRWSIYIENSIPLIEKDNGKSINYNVAGRHISPCGQFIDRSAGFGLELDFGLRTMILH